MALAGIELRYLVNKISEEVQGYYVSNIYGINRDSILFKMHHTEKSDIFMMISTSGIWITSVRIEQIEENRLQRRLRSDLLRLKLKQIRQIGAERVAYIVFEGFGKEFVLVGEFFGDGNIILCNEQMKILALQHSIDVRHRKIHVGLEYTPPPSQNEIDIFNITESNFDGLATTELRGAKWLGRTLGLPRRYAEGIFGIAKINSKTPGIDMNEIQIKQLYESTKEIVSDVASGRHNPIIKVGEQTEVLPVALGSQDESDRQIDDFIKGIDMIFTESLLKEGRAAQSGGSEKKLKELQTQLEEQEKAVDTVKERSKAITTLANSILAMISQGIITIRDERVQQQIQAENNATLGSEKGVPHIAVAGQKIKINLESPLYSIASVLFDEAKHQSRAVPSIEKIMTKTKQKIDKLQNKSETEKNAITASEIRKKSWYERYRWFPTSDGLLAVGGRDVASNSAVIRKQMQGNDRIFHAEIHGSPFFILKDATDMMASDSMKETAHATVCFSRAWREGMYGMSAYWVMPHQVKKSAPTGQFLPKGSFTIEGQRNFIKPLTLQLAVGAIQQGDNGYTLSCGPPEPIKRYSVCYAIIQPQGSEMVEVAKKIRVEFIKMEGDIAKSINIDDFVRALPAGKSQIKDIGYGDSETHQKVHTR